jgi:hypothetical protein
MDNQADAKSTVARQVLNKDEPRMTRENITEVESKQDGDKIKW